MRKSKYIIYIEFFKPQKPEDIEKTIRKLSKKKEIPSFRNLLVCIHHKNLKRIGEKDIVPIVIKEK